MKAASMLVSGHQPTPELAQAAVRGALERAGLTRAGQVILLLSKDFVRASATSTSAALLAAGRAAGTLQVGGMTASGLFNEEGWQIDQPAAVALVIEGITDPASQPSATVSLTGQTRLPYAWLDAPPRYGLLEHGGLAWQQARISTDACSTLTLPGLRLSAVISRGLRALGDWHIVTECRGLDIIQLDRQPALNSLRRLLPAEDRTHPPLHQLLAMRDEDCPGIPILSAHADGRLSLAESLQPGERLHWMRRQSLAAAQEIRGMLQAAVNLEKPPKFGLMLSCIGRGPVFYGSDDEDLQAFRSAFPDTPLLGAYGTGQIVPAAAGNQLLTGTTLTLLFEETDV